MVRDSGTNIRQVRRGFTLVELLVVVLILAILMAVALPLYLNAVENSARRTCRANMQTIANAVQAARVKDRATDYSAYTDLSKVPDLSTIPVCPSRSSGSSTTSYTVVTDPTYGFKVQCAIDTKHGDFTPGKDNE